MLRNVDARGMPEIQGDEGRTAEDQLARNSEWKVIIARTSFK